MIVRDRDGNFWRCVNGIVEIRYMTEPEWEQWFDQTYDGAPDARLVPTTYKEYAFEQDIVTDYTGPEAVINPDDLVWGAVAWNDTDHKAPAFIQRVIDQCRANPEEA